jgi:hypothetical protein
MAKYLTKRQRQVLVGVVRFPLDWQQRIAERPLDARSARGLDKTLDTLRDRGLVKWRSGGVSKGHFSMGSWGPTDEGRKLAEGCHEYRLDDDWGVE